MKGTLSLVISILVAALAVGVPAAFADPGLNGAPEMSSTPTPDWFERAAAAAERQGAVAPYVDAFERPDSAVQVSAPYVDAFERPPAVSAETTSSTIDARAEIAWGQISIAFGVGLMLALGLMLAVRSRPTREVAH